MFDILGYATFFVSIIFFGISPFPALPLVLAAYLRYSYAALPLVFLASFVTAILQYFIGMYLPRWSFSSRSFKNNQIVHRFGALFEDVTIESLVFIRSAGFVPSKVFNFCCGLCKVPFSLFSLSLIPSLLLYQFIYLAGVSASMFVNTFLSEIGLSQLHWFVLFLFYLFFVFLFSVFSSFLLKIVVRLFRRRFPVA